MKQNMILGKGTGKLGGMVFSQVFGQQIVREYNPIVSNPSTSLQVNQRARLKLASSLAACVSSAIAIPRDGLKSPRNQFMSENFDAITAANGEAQVNLSVLQLTKGSAYLPDLVVSGGQGSAVTVELADAAHESISRVAYVMYGRMVNGTLSLIDSVVTETPGSSRKFPATLAATNADVVVYAYGMKDSSDDAKARYGALNVNNAITLASLVATRTIAASDYTFTRTSFGSTAATGSISSVTFDGHSIERGGDYSMEGPAPESCTLIAQVANLKAGVNYTVEIIDENNQTIQGCSAAVSNGQATIETRNMWYKDCAVVLKAGDSIIDSYCTLSNGNS